LGVSLAGAKSIARRQGTAALREFSRLYVRFGSKADIIHDLADVRFTPECVAKLSLRPRANRDSVGLRGDSRERSMMGRREGGQGQFFYAFDLDNPPKADID